MDEREDDDNGNHRPPECDHRCSLEARCGDCRCGRGSDWGHRCGLRWRRRGLIYCRNRSCAGLQLRLHLLQGSSAFGIELQAIARDAAIRFGNCFRQALFARSSLFSERNVLRNGCYQSHAQRPDVTGRRQDSCGRFRGVINVTPPCRARFRQGRDLVRRKLQLISHRQNIRWLDAAVHHAPAMEIGHRVQHGREQVGDFVGRQRALRQDLRQILVRQFHDHVNERVRLDLAAARLENPDQMRMGKLDGRADP